MDLPNWFWPAFCIGTLAILMLDLLIQNRKEVSMRETIFWNILWFVLGLAFTGVVFWLGDKQKAIEYVTGYLIERSLSIDNVFVFTLILAAFAVPAVATDKVLTFGIVAAILLRAIFIFAGAALLEASHYVIYLFGGILVFTGIKLLKGQEHEIDPAKHIVARICAKFMPITDGHRESKLFSREPTTRSVAAGKPRKRLHLTPLFVALLVIAAADIVFAVDSIPAIFAITTDPSIVLFANVLALLGMRALYALVADLVERFKYLDIGLAIVLIWIGIKMLISGVYHVPTVLSLLIVVGVIGGAIIISLIKTRDMADTPPAAT